MSMILHSLAEMQQQLANGRNKAIQAIESTLGIAATAMQEDARDRISAQPAASEGLRESIVSESHGLEAVVGSNDPAAARLEFGTESAPPHPFLAPVAIESQDAMQAILAEAVLGALSAK